MECPQQEYRDQASLKTSFKIVEQIGFQKFRYHGENRPGKKKQKKDFMTLLVRNPPARFLHVHMICVDADVQDKVKVHPNGLVGVGCHHGLYDMLHPVLAGTEGTFTIVIPYIRIERLKLKKNDKQIIKEELNTRMSYLPSPYREYFAGQCAGVASFKDVDSSKVRLAVIVSGKGCSGWLEKPWDVSNVIKDGSQKTSLGILKLSRSQVPASTGAWVDVFTTVNSPPIIAGEYLLHVTYEPAGASGKLAYWMSEETIPGEDCIIYNKVISYKIPPFEPGPYLKSPVKATLHLVCPESNMSCVYYFSYVPERGGTKLEPRNDGGVSMHASPDRWRSTKRSRCDSSLDSQIIGSLKMKPVFQGDIIYQVRCNAVIAPDPDCSLLSTDAQMPNAKVAAVGTSTSTNMAKLLSVRGTDESTTANNNWVTPTSVHHDSQNASNNWMAPTSVHHDSQTVNNNWVRPTSVHHDSQNASNNWMTPTSVHQDSQAVNNNRMTPTSVHQDSQTVNNNWVTPTSVHHDSQNASNNWMTPTSVHHDSQNASNNWVRPTSVHHDSQNASNNWMTPTSVHHDSQTVNNNRMTPTSVHHDSQNANNIWMGPTSVHQDRQTVNNNRTTPTSAYQDSQTDNNNRMRPTSVHQDSQTVNNNRMRPTSAYQDSQTDNNNRMRPTSVHCDILKATIPHNNVKAKSEFTKCAIYMGNYQPMSCGSGRSSAHNPNVLNEQHGSFVQEMGASSRGQSTQSYSVQQPIRDVTVNNGRDVKPGCSNSQQLFTKHSQCLLQRAAWHDVSGTSLPFQNSARTNIPQHLKDNQCAELVECTEYQQEITAKQQDSHRNDWASQNQPNKDNFDYTKDSQQSKAVSDIKYLQSTEETGHFDADDDQISSNFLPNLDSSETSSVNQTVPTATSNNSGTHISTNLSTMELFAEAAENLLTLDLFNWLADTN